jgi:signal transduction histidine kinase
LLAVWLDPTEPTRLVGFTYWLLAGYVLLSIALAQWSWTARSAPAALPLIVHGLDLGIFFLLIVVTAGPDSPFFIFLVFALVAATVRWQAAGTFWTGLVALVAFLAAGFVAERIDPASGFELNRFIIRNIYLVVLAVLLGYVGDYERRLRAKVATLGEWPVVLPTDTDDAIRALLEHAAKVLHAPRIALVWEEEEEPWSNVAIWSGSSLEWHRGPPGGLDPLAPAALAERSFFAARPQGERGEVRLVTTAGIERTASDPIPAGLREHVGEGSALSVPLRGESVVGRFLALDSPGMTSDEIVLGEILARQIALQMDRLALFERFHRDALADERMRLASDVHDGVIQSLAGAALRLETARQVLDQEPADAARLIEESQDLLVSEQRELREFIGGLALGDRAAAASNAPLGLQIEALRSRIARHWDLRVVVHGAESFDGRIDARLTRQLYNMVHEALVNASRHGKASEATVELSMQDSEIHLTVTDDGCGFPFRGRYDFATLTAMKLGPLSLKRRITTLGGRLEIVSTESGARLEVWLPIELAGG